MGAALAGRATTNVPQGAALAEIVLEHYEAMLSDYGTAIGARVARKHLDWYLEGAGIALDGDTRKTLLGSEAPVDVKRTITAIFDEDLRQAA